MKFFNDVEFDMQMKELIDMIDAYEFQDMELEYIAQLDKLKIDLSNKAKTDIVAYIDLLKDQIAELVSDIVERFSIHNEHLCKEYMYNLIETDRILFAKLNHTTKNDDCIQYIRAKEQYGLEYKDMLLSIPEVYALSIVTQNDLWNMSMHIAELNFLSNQHWTINA